ncbi:MAG: tRNA pseudouridine(13) synthase TruD [Planctomycetota bacterium]
MKIKQTPEDFRVIERISPAIEPSGGHSLYWLRKKKLTTPEAIRELASANGLSPTAFAFAGLKDRQGVTEQVISVTGKTIHYESSQIKLKYLGRSGRPVQRDDSEGNRFEITVRKLDRKGIERVLENAEEVRKTGVPNYFDSQRFGCLRHGQGFIARNVIQGDFETALQKLIAAKSPYETKDSQFKGYLRKHWGDWAELAGKHRRSLFSKLFSYLAKRPGDFRGAVKLVPLSTKLIHLCAYQSFLWNEMLRRVLEGEVAAAAKGGSKTMAAASGEGSEVTEESPRELDSGAGPRLLGTRYECGWLTFPAGSPEQKLTELKALTIPLPAAKSRPTDPRIAQAMQKVLDLEGLRTSDLNIQDQPGFIFKEEPRAALLFPEDLEISEAREDELNKGFFKIRVAFSLPRGAYGSLVLKRLLATEAPREAKNREPRGIPESYREDPPRSHREHGHGDRRGPGRSGPGQAPRGDRPRFDRRGEASERVGSGARGPARGGGGPAREGRGPRRDDRGTGPRGPRDDRKPWAARDDRGPREQRSGGPSGPRGQWRGPGGPRDDRGPRQGDRKPWAGRDDRGPRDQRSGGPTGQWRGPGGPRDDRGPRQGDRKPWAGRDDRGPRDQRSGGPSGQWRGPGGPRDDRGPRQGDRKPWAGRDDRGPRDQRSGGPSGQWRGPGGPRDDRGPRQSERKPWVARDDRGPRDQRSGGPSGPKGGGPRREGWRGNDSPGGRPGPKPFRGPQQDRGPARGPHGKPEGSGRPGPKGPLSFKKRPGEGDGSASESD